MAQRRTTLGWDWAMAGAHASTTLFHRLSMFGALATMSDADQRAEQARMVNEKLAAGVEGAFDASMQAMRLMTAAAFGQLKPHDVLAAPETIMRAGLKPAMRKVRANSKRLRRRALKPKA